MEQGMCCWASCCPYGGLFSRGGEFGCSGIVCSIVISVRPQQLS